MSRTLKPKKGLYVVFPNGKIARIISVDTAGRQMLLSDGYCYCYGDDRIRIISRLQAVIIKLFTDI